MVDPFIERIIALFTAAEWRAMIWLLLTTLAATHTLKILWRLAPVKGGGNNSVQLLAVVAGLGAAFAIWPEQSIPWYAAGVVAGPASSIAFKIGFALLGKFLPTVAAAINFDRRKVDSGPPAGTPGRREEDK